MSVDNVTGRADIAVANAAHAAAAAPPMLDESVLADSAQVLAALPRRISAIPALNATRYPQATALREGDSHFSFGELSQAAIDVATKLATAGVRPGDRVLIVGENCAALVALLFGVARLDAWAVIVNARLTPPEIDAIKDHCSPRRSVYLTNVSPDAAQHARRHAAVEHLSIAAMGIA
ncbi:MAG: AMP-binding protein, partial [Lysobacterales bacterium]